MFRRDQNHTVALSLLTATLASAACSDHRKPSEPTQVDYADFRIDTSDIELLFQNFPALSMQAKLELSVFVVNRYCQSINSTFDLLRGIPENKKDDLQVFAATQFLAQVQADLSVEPRTVPDLLDPNEVNGVMVPAEGGTQVPILFEPEVRPLMLAVVGEQRQILKELNNLLDSWGPPERPEVVLALELLQLVHHLKAHQLFDHAELIRISLSQ